MIRRLELEVKMLNATTLMQQTPDFDAKLQYFEKLRELSDEYHNVVYGGTKER